MPNKPLVGLPDKVQEHLAYLREGMIVLSESGGQLYETYKNLIGSKIHDITSTLHERDLQIKESLDFYLDYVDNHLRFLTDFPEYNEKISSMTHQEYRIFLLKEVAFKEFYKK